MLFAYAMAFVHVKYNNPYSGLNKKTFRPFVPNCSTQVEIKFDRCYLKGKNSVIVLLSRELVGQLIIHL